MMQIKWLQTARLTLRQQIDFLEQHNQVAARLAYDATLDMVLLIAEHPKIGRTGRARGTREMVVGGTKFIIIYRLRKEAVEIVRILHSSRIIPRVCGQSAIV